ncbi:MAG TPA: NDP-sugar synthase [Poseidonia sp.]|nr:NDP-sugar synthase [Poseidonia sp.]
MIGIIMAGGQGSRLRPLTLTRPKPMVEVIGRPVIDFVKEAMADAGIDEIIVTTGYRGEQLKAHVATWNDSGDSSLHASVNQESTPMGTAGSVGLLREKIQTTCVVGSGDSVASFDINRLLKQHRENKAKVTMALWEVDNPSEFGIVGLSSEQDGEVDGSLRSGFISKFKEKPAPEEAFSNVINAGLYIIEPEVIDLIPEGEKFDFSKQLFPLVLEKGWPMYAETINGVWFDVGHPSELLRAQTTLLQQYQSLPFSLPEGSWVGDDGFILTDAIVHGDAVSSVISQSCVVESSAKIISSLLMKGCKVAENAEIKGSILGREVIVEAGAVLIDCVIGDGQVVSSGSILRSALIPPSE